MDGEEARVAAAGEVPKQPPSVSFSLFLSGKFLLLKPATPYKEGPVFSHSPPLQLDQGLSGSGLVKSQLSIPPTWRTKSLWVSTHGAHMSTWSTYEHTGFIAPVCLPLCPYSPPCDCKQPDLSWCCSNLAWQGREPLTRLSPKNPVADPVGDGPGDAAALVPVLDLWTLLS